MMKLEAFSNWHLNVNCYNPQSQNGMYIAKPKENKYFNYSYHVYKKLQVMKSLHKQLLWKLTVKTMMNIAVLCKNVFFP